MRLLAPLLCAVAIPAQGKVTPAASAEQNVVALVKQLGEETDHQRRYDAYNVLQRERPPAALALLVEALPRYGLQSQSLGLSLLQSYPPQPGHDALRQIMKPGAPFLQLGAAAVLFRAGDHSVLEHVLQPLARADVPAATRCAMLGRLFGIADARVSAAVRAWLVPESDVSVLDAALAHLMQVKDKEAKSKVTALIASATASPDVQAICAAFLLQEGEVTHGDALAAAIRARGGALLARVQRYLLAAPRLPAAVLAAVLEVAESAEVAWHVQTALAVLGAHASSKELPLMRRLLAHKDPLIAKAALEAFQKRAGALPATELARLLASPEPQLALAAADVLRRMDDTTGLPRVLELLAAPGTHRAEATRVLGRFRQPNVVPPLLDALADADLAVRSAALLGLQGLLPSLFPYRRFDLASSGYTANAPAGARDAAVAKIRAWWDAHAPK